MKITIKSRILITLALALVIVIPGIASAYCGPQGYVDTPNGVRNYCFNPTGIVAQHCVGYTPSYSCVGTKLYQYDCYIGFGDVVNRDYTCSCDGNQFIQDCATTGQTCSVNGCVGSQNNNCTQNTTKQCSGNSVYNYDSCGNQGSLYQTCNSNQTCSNGSCTSNCTSNYQQKCWHDQLYWYDSCGAQQGYIQSCPNGCYNNSCQNYNNNCTYHSYEKCSGNSLYWYDSCGAQQEVAQYCPNGCYNNSCQANYNNYTYTNYNYTNTNYSNLTVTKTVRNLTSGTGFANSTYASPSDVLMFMITLQATGQDAQNVIVRDTLPSNLIYNSQLVVACTGLNSNNFNCTNYNTYNNSGNIISGVNLNTIYSGQTVTITYQAQVAGAANFTYGTTTLTNNVSVTSSNNGYTPTGNASVIITKSTVLGASTVSTGLTNNFWVDSFFLPLLLTLIGIWLWRTGMFFGIERWLDKKRKVRRSYKAEKEFTHRIAEIQRFGR